MCHLLLILPLVSLALFRVLPVEVAAPLYALATAVSLAFYGYVWKAMRLPLVNGRESMLSARGRVVHVGERGAVLRLHGELWSTRAAAGALAVGDEAVVVGIDGLSLRVEKVPAATGIGRPGETPGFLARHPSGSKSG